MLFLLIPERIFHVGKYLELQFEFKTSELNGVLLSVAEPVGFPALSIEMHNGKVCDWRGNSSKSLIAITTMAFSNFFFTFRLDNDVL